MANILVVDDPPSTSAVLAGILRSAGHEVREASTASEALALALREPPDLVVAGAFLPSVDGFELVRRIRTDPGTARVRVALTTAVPLDEEALELAEALGVGAILPSSLLPRAILSAVEAALADAPAPVPMTDEAFDRAHLSLLRRHLLALVGERETEHHERQRLLGHLIRAHEEERGKIAGTLHDDAIQSMAAASMRIELLARKLQDPDLLKLVSPLIEGIHHSIEGLRRIMAQLRPPDIAGGLALSLEVLLNRHSRDAGYRYAVTSSLDDDPPQEIGILLYRIAQEALVDLVERSGAALVSVDLGQGEGGFFLRITGDGRGIPQQAIPESVQLANGRWRVEGAALVCWIPAGAGGAL
jgi:signal transduction histidine kinase